MKRHIALLSMVIIFVSILSGCKVHRIGKPQYYVQITVDGKEQGTIRISGEKITIYEYKLVGYNRKGKEKTLEFTAQKNLRKDAFLRVFYSEEKGVTSYQEVTEDDIPTKAKEKLGLD